MTAWVPAIVAIENIEKHPNADNLDIVSVMGDHPVITKSGEYKIGDLASYLPIDTIVEDKEEYSFLFPKAFEQVIENGLVKNKVCGLKYPIGSTPESKRVIKACRLRGIYSMGLLLPPIPNLQIGDSIVDALNLKKFDEDNYPDENVPGNKIKSADALSPPKHFDLPYYDIHSLRGYSNLFIPEEEVVLTEKIHGSFFAIIFDEKDFWVKSRRLYKKESDVDSWQVAANNLSLKEKITKYPNFAFFGELCGTQKKFNYDIIDQDKKIVSKIKFFDIYDITKKRYLDYDDFLTVINDLNLETTPLLYRGPYLDKKEMYLFSEGKSTLNSTHCREGFVIKPVKYRYEKAILGPLRLKHIGEEYSIQKSSKY